MLLELKISHTSKIVFYMPYQLWSKQVLLQYYVIDVSEPINLRYFWRQKGASPEVAKWTEQLSASRALRCKGIILIKR